MRSRLLALLATIAFIASPTDARVMGVIWGPPTPITAPVLADVSVKIGALTQAGQGGVKLSSRDVSTYGFPFNGLDMWDGTASHTPTSWHITDTTATAGYTPGTHWELDGTTTCKAGPILVAGLGPPTPRPCAAGVSAALNKGPYTFSITATDADGNTSDPKTLTYTIVANTANIGDQAADGPSTAVPTTWKSGSMPSGATIALSTGANWITRVNSSGVSSPRMIWQAMDFSLGSAHQVNFIYADAAKPGGLWDVEINNIKNMEVQGITVTGPGPTPDAVGFLLTGNSDTILMQDDAAIYTEADQVNTNRALYLDGASHVTVNNFTADYASHCIYEFSQWNSFNNSDTINHAVCGHMFANFLTVGNSTDLTLNDIFEYAPMRNSGSHADSLQVSNTASPTNLTVNRLMVMQADGDAFTQGPAFGGRPGIMTGYVTNNGVTNTFHATASSTPFTTTGSPLVSVADNLGVSIAATTRLVTACSGQNTTCTISGPLQTVGSPGHEVRVYTGPFTNFKFDGIIFASGQQAGFTTVGFDGTGYLKDFSFIKSNAYGNGADLANVYFTGAITNTVGSDGQTYQILTASNVTGNIVGLFAGERILWTSTPGSPCNLLSVPGWTTNLCVTPQQILIATPPAGVVFTPPLTGTGSAGTYYIKGPGISTIAATSMMASFDYPIVNGPQVSLADTGTAEVALMYPPTGTFHFTSGYMWDNAITKANTGQGSPTNPTQVIFDASATFGAQSYVTAASAFSAGDPMQGLSTITTAQWKAKTLAQKVAAYAAALAPKTGGPLDASGGAGSWYGAVTPINDAGEYCWNNGGIWDHTKTCAQNGMSVLAP